MKKFGTLDLALDRLADAIRFWMREEDIMDQRTWNVGRGSNRQNPKIGGEHDGSTSFENAVRLIEDCGL